MPVNPPGGVAVPEPGAGAREAVNVTACPRAEGLGAAVRLVTVAAGRTTWDAVPLLSTKTLPPS